MVDAKVDRTLILERLRGDFSRVLPFRFIAAAKYAPSLAQEIGEAMERQLENELVALNGRTVLLVDVSGSMNDKLSAKSEMTRMEAASAMAMLFRARCESVRVLTFSNSLVEVPNYKGMALRDAIVNSQSHSGTYLGRAVNTVNAGVECDRLVVLTDEQSHDRVDEAKAPKAYMLNVGAYEHGVGFGPWVRVSGWSERLVDFIIAAEAQDVDEGNHE